MKTISIKTRSGPLDKPYSVEDSVKHLINGVDTCKRWAANYKTGHICTKICYTTPPLKRTIVNGENAKANIRIVKLTKDDNKSLIALSALAMLFLPGTFVAVRET